MQQVEKSIQQKIQMLLPVVLRTLGPILLRSGIGGLGGGGATTSTTNDDDFGDDDDSDGDSTSDGNASTKKGSNGRKVSISLPTFPPDVDDDEDDDDEDAEEDVKANDVSSNNVETAKATTKVETVVTTPSTAPTSTAILTENDNDNAAVSNVFGTSSELSSNPSTSTSSSNINIDSDSDSSRLDIRSETINKNLGDQTQQQVSGSNGYVYAVPTTPSIEYLPPINNVVRRRKDINRRHKLKN